MPLAAGRVDRQRRPSREDLEQAVGASAFDLGRQFGPLPGSPEPPLQGPALPPQFDLIPEQSRTLSPQKVTPNLYGFTLATGSAVPVNIEGVRNELLETLPIVGDLMDAFRLPRVITSGTDRPKTFDPTIDPSFHPFGFGLDFRVPKAVGNDFNRELKRRLPPGFQSVFETDPDHIHLELDTARSRRLREEEKEKQKRILLGGG